MLASILIITLATANDIAAPTATKAIGSIPSGPGRSITITPTKPSPVAHQRCRVTASRNSTIATMVVNTIRENDSEVALASGRLITEISVPTWAIEAMTSRVACRPSRLVLRPDRPARQNSGDRTITPTR